MAHFQKPSYKRKNLAKISYTTRVIANFVPNFVGIATGIGQKKAIGSVRSPIPETLFTPIGLGKKISNKSLTKAELQ